MGQNINLLEALPTPTVVTFPTNMAVMLLGAWLVLLTFIYVIGFISLKFKESDLSNLEKNKQKLSAQVATTVETITQIIQAKQTPIQFAATPETQTKGFSTYLTDLAKSTPDNIWLDVIRFEEPADTIFLQGSAFSPALIPSFLSGLGATDSFRNKKFSTLQLQKPESGGKIKFTLSNTPTVEAEKPQIIAKPELKK